MIKDTSTFSESQQTIITWVLLAVALAFFTARILIRLKVYGHLKVDDGLVILAVLCLLAADILWEVTKDTAIAVQKVHIFHESRPKNFQQDLSNYSRYIWADAYLFFTGIWAVKGAFLAYYDSLTRRLVNFRWAWWAVVVLTILTYIGSLFANAFLDGIHFTSPIATLKNEAINYQFSVDFLTDVLITMIPLAIALKSQVSTKQKLALAGVFSLSLIITVFSTVRFALNRPTRVSSPSWIQTWTTIEQSVSVTVACLASFRTLVISNKQHSSRRNEKNENGSTLRKDRFPSDAFGFSHLRSYGASPTLSARGSMDIELLETRHGPPQRTAGSKVAEVLAIPKASFADLEAPYAV